MTPAERKQFFRSAVRGLPPYRVWRALNRLTSGINWVGMPKEGMAECFCTPGYLGTNLHAVSPEALSKAMQAERADHIARRIAS